MRSGDRGAALEFVTYGTSLNGNRLVGGLCWCWLIEIQPLGRSSEVKVNRFVKEIEAKEPELQARLDRIRIRQQHSGNIGDALKQAFRELLREVLPRKYEIGHGEIIDSLGQHAGRTNKDGQIDVIVLDGQQPQLSPLNEPNLFPIEHCLMIGEVKTRLTRAELDKTIKRGSDVKKLMPYSFEGDISYTDPQAGRGFFLFCWDSD